MAAYDGDKTIRTEAFDQDLECKTFTLKRADNDGQFAYSMARFNKITANRYVGWTLEIPEEFADLAKEYAVRRHWYRDYAKGPEGGNVLKPKERTGVHVS